MKVYSTKVCFNKMKKKKTTIKEQLGCWDFLLNPAVFK